MSSESMGLDWVESGENSVFCEWRWNDKDCGEDIIVHAHKLGVTFHPVRSMGCAVVRGDKALRQNMEHYFEVEIKEPFHGKARQVGIGTKHTALQSSSCDFYPLIGKDLSSWGVNYDGFKSNAGNTKRHISIDPDKYSIIRVAVHYDAYYGTVAFELNGKSSGLAYEKVHTNIDMYPMLCASAAGTQMRLTYSSSSVMSLKALSRGVIRSSVRKEKDLEKLILPHHLKSYVLYQTSKSGKSSTTGSNSGSSRRHHHHNHHTHHSKSATTHSRNRNCHESTL